LFIYNDISAFKENLSLGSSSHDKRDLETVEYSSLTCIVPSLAYAKIRCK